jgi:biopolymer transport protein ExbB
VRSADWARTAFASQGPDGLLYSFGMEELGGGGGLPVFYLKTIFKNISLDGWVIITLLVIFSGMSWYVFLTKAFFIRLAEREDRDFMDAYENHNSLVGLNHDGDETYQNSSLYRLYRAGEENLMTLITHSEQSGKETCMTARNMNAFKATLEKGFVDETKRLNSGLVFLIMAISGGPFLGLLGTVWGVMNTFAAMAEAGEASIMAIAPGVASALSTTVFGLIVAIPALFSYNYLLARVKNITADMTVFIDQFTLMADETYGEA